MSMTSEEARAALKQLGMSQLDLAKELRAMTGKGFKPQAVTKWFNERKPTDVCVVYLKMALRLQAAEADQTGSETTES